MQFQWLKIIPYKIYYIRSMPLGPYITQPVPSGPHIEGEGLNPGEGLFVCGIWAKHSTTPSKPVSTRPNATTASHGFRAPIRFRASILLIVWR